MSNPKKLTDTLRNWNIAKSYLKNGPNIRNIINALKYMLDGPSSKQTGSPPILPGFHLKGLLQGSMLELQLSKLGTISTNAVKSLANKSGKFEGKLLNTVLDNLFPNLRVIDYNKFRSAVLKHLIPYEIKETTKYANYGMDRLGLDDFQLVNGEFVRPTPLTFTFESPRIPMGNGLHYSKNTLGHTRAFTLNDGTLSVMESLSDWALHPWGVATYNKMNKAAPHRLSLLRKMIAQLKERGLPTLETESRIPYQLLYKDISAEHIKHLQDTYLLKLLLENMLFASRRGFNKMRYPTRDTAIKVEGYEPTLLFLGHPELELKALNLLLQIGLLEVQLHLGTNIFNYERLSKLLQSLKNEYNILKLKSTGQVYSSQEETILKKYDQFPKMFGKVFKDLKPLIVSDSKGNSWFELAIPKDMLQMELVYKNGGCL